MIPNWGKTKKQPQETLPGSQVNGGTALDNNNKWGLRATSSMPGIMQELPNILLFREIQKLAQGHMAKTC